MNALDANNVTLLGIGGAFAKTCSDKKKMIAPEKMQSFYDTLSYVCYWNTNSITKTINDDFKKIKSVIKNNIDNIKDRQEFQAKFFENFADFCYQAAGVAAGPVGKVATDCKCKK